MLTPVTGIVLAWKGLPWSPEFSQRKCVASLVPRPFHVFQRTREKSGRPDWSGDVIVHSLRCGCISLPTRPRSLSRGDSWPHSLSGWRYATTSQTMSHYITRSTRPSQFFSRMLENMGTRLSYGLTLRALILPLTVWPNYSAWRWQPTFCSECSDDQNSQSCMGVSKVWK